MHIIVFYICNVCCSMTLPDVAYLITQEAGGNVTLGVCTAWLGQSALAFRRPKRGAQARGSCHVATAAYVPSYSLRFGCKVRSWPRLVSLAYGLSLTEQLPETEFADCL